MPYVPVQYQNRRSKQAAISQIVSDDDVRYSIKDEVNIIGVSGAGEMRVYLLDLNREMEKGIESCVFNLMISKNREGYLQFLDNSP